MDKKLADSLEYADRVLAELHQATGVDTREIKDLGDYLGSVAVRLIDIDAEIGGLRPGDNGAAFEKKSAELLTEKARLELVRDSVAAEIVDKTAALRANEFVTRRPDRLLDLEAAITLCDNECLTHLQRAYAALERRVPLMRQYDGLWHVYQGIGNDLAGKVEGVFAIADVDRPMTPFRKPVNINGSDWQVSVNLLELYVSHVLRLLGTGQRFPDNPPGRYAWFSQLPKRV